jgi:Kef-type K+ transport system membrane component KefB
MALAGFIAGLIIPHENGFAISLTEKLEDLVTLMLIPIVRPSCRPLWRVA